MPGKTFSGKVNYIDPFIDAQTRVAKVRVELNNPKQELKPEMFANGMLKSSIAGRTNKLLIPKSSVLWTGKKAIVYVKIPERGTASFINREIILGVKAGNFYVVAEGLTEGEEIATNGVFKIDAAAQLAGKPSMMNPENSKVLNDHHHENIE
jgi:Cu(I)/Ag(I) efflux system membrane fusion protein